MLPPSAPLLAHRLGLANSGAIDLAGACSGFLYALTLADGFVRTQGRPVLVVAANILSRRINPAERASAVLFADAAGAVVLVPSDNTGAGTSRCGSCLGRKPLRSDLDSGWRHQTAVCCGYGGGGMPDDHARWPGNVCAGRANDDPLRQAGAGKRGASACRRSTGLFRIRPMPVSSTSLARISVLSLTGSFARSLSTATPPLPPFRFRCRLPISARPFVPGEKLLLTAAGAGLTGGAVVVGV